jgi:hypothetical protein
MTSYQIGTIKEEVISETPKDFKRNMLPVVAEEAAPETSSFIDIDFDDI